MIRVSATVCLAVATLLLCACGQKGALYLPESTRVEVPATSAAPASTEDADKDSRQSK